MRQACLAGLSLLLLAACAPGPRPQTAASPAGATPVAASATPASGQRQSMKGFALFSWLDDAKGSYHYALLEATNALPDLARVRQQASPDLDALLVQLHNLKPGESVFWNFQVSMISSMHFMLPPTPDLERIRQTAASQGLKLEIDAFFADQARETSEP